MILEKNELLLGLQLGREWGQITYYNNTMKEPVTAGSDRGSENYLIPMPEKAWAQMWEKTGPLDALTEFLAGCLKRVEGMGRPEEMRVMVCVPQMKEPVGERIPEALMKLGILRKYIFMQDYRSSFYYYTINQKKELWSADVALFEYEQECMTGYVLHIDRSTRPALVTVEEAAAQPVNEQVRDQRGQEEWDRERDRLFFELLKKVFNRRNVTTCFLIGDYFDKSWAKRSFQYLCYHRHAFQGKNLFTKGACYGAMERTGLMTVPDLLFMGEDIVHENLGMYLRIRGKEVYYPLITAGVNWYEASHSCEIIPDEEAELTIVTKPMTGGQELSRLLRLTDFPKRPNRATRLRLSVYFVSASRCVVEAEDLGFGGFYRPSGKIWKREIIF